MYHWTTRYRNLGVDINTLMNINGRKYPAHTG